MPLYGPEVLAVIQRKDAENKCICGFNYDQHTYDKDCDSHGVCPDRQGVFRNERQHELIKSLEKEKAALVAENEGLRKGLNAVAALIKESYGVSGLHLNGDIASWDELRTGGRFEDWLIDFDTAIDNAMKGGGE